MHWIAFIKKDMSLCFHQLWIKGVTLSHLRIRFTFWIYVQRICIWRDKFQTNCQLPSYKTRFPFSHNILLKLNKSTATERSIWIQRYHSLRTPTGIAHHRNHVSHNTLFLIQTSWEPFKQRKTVSDTLAQYILKG